MNQSKKVNFNKIFTSLALAVIFGTTNFQFAYAKDSQSENTAQKPIIGLNMAVRGKNPTECKISTTYVNAILKSGGIPILIPPMNKVALSSLFKRLDGVLLIGGRDYPPAIYGKKNHKAVVKMHPLRTELDSQLAKLVLKDGKIPFLGICAGAQILNITSGGTLVRDIPSRYPKAKKMHACQKGWQSGSNTHAVKLADTSKISKIYNNTNIEVCSSHHQCVDKIGKGLKVTGHAPDGVKESYEASAKDRFVIGVQWHPEQDLKNHHHLFDEFVNQCVQFKSTKDSMNKDDKIAKTKD